MEIVGAPQESLFMLSRPPELPYNAKSQKIPKIIINLSSDFFINGKKPRMDDQNLLIRIVFSLIKNALGFLLFLCGIIMLFIPGQGLLTMFLGLVLMDIPGKHRLQLYFLRLRAVQKSLNWIRNKNGAPPFIYND